MDLHTALGTGHIFVSHSRWDRARAMSLVDSLLASGMSTWICGPELHAPGWQNAVFPQIAECAAVVVVAGAHADAADGVAQEVAYARRLGKPVLQLAPSGFTAFSAASRTQRPTDEPRYAALGR